MRAAKYMESKVAFCKSTIHDIYDFLTVHMNDNMRAIPSIFTLYTFDLAE
ncbi:hypothetical protein Q0F98_38555 [Paenibacillus amylolyticus]|nr:hypothetical protein Q0F98_38555 [Paenibacillus amylolyticus]